MNNPSVCFLLSRFAAGGLERVQTHIAAGFANTGINIEVVARAVEIEACSLFRPEVPVRELGGGRFCFVYRLLRWLHKVRPNVIITSANDIGCLVLLLRRLLWKDSKIIWTQHLSISGPLRSANTTRRIRLFFEKVMMRYLVRHADSVVAVTRSVADDMRRTLDPNLSIRVIYNPVIDQYFDTRSKEEINWPWEPSETPVVIFVGRLARVKRLDLLLQAFSLCIKKTPIKLLIVGEGPERGMAEKLAKELCLGASCQFIGHSDNPLPWIRQADILVLCSDSEGFGLVLVEAMGCGTQIVATDCPDGPAEILEGGRYGRLVPVDNAVELAAAMQEALHSPLAAEAELMARAAEFSVDGAVTQYLDLIDQLTRK
ncbi:glycosyltransferase [Halopseudomonas yangmingensis]|uniref:Glycosyltransferase involved in cell wall bisynthesis n=1 Tax=Halopseudomonas yangmingensis TaxID=1720063 RepID=A0A1I4NYL3_9GAMM|nr:glycosyltransferase [Halopseudomonas yangmingensis]SFM20559.1 Glycosyltransferase involved in cell wall bisynthesis [Halopseudomonas yangmingensis]